jgi:hypothetical protein
MRASSTAVCVRRKAKLLISNAKWLLKVGANRPFLEEVQRMHAPLLPAECKLSNNQVMKVGQSVQTEYQGVSYTCECIEEGGTADVKCYPDASESLIKITSPANFLHSVDFILLIE